MKISKIALATEAVRRNNLALFPAFQDLNPLSILRGTSFAKLAYKYPKDQADHPAENLSGGLRVNINFMSHNQSISQC